MEEAYKCGRFSEHSSWKGGAIVAMELEAVRRLVQERGSDLAFVVNHSGGKDSTRMLGFVRKNFWDSRPMWCWQTPDSSTNGRSPQPTLRAIGVRSLD